MNSLEFLAGWALRSSILISAGGLLLLALRVKDPAIRLAAWASMLCASLAMPLFTLSVPRTPVPIEPFGIAWQALPPQAALQPRAMAAAPFDWPRVAIFVYGAVTLTLLLRLLIGWAMSIRLWRCSGPTEITRVRESAQINTPVTLGVVRPGIVLPVCWRQWGQARLDAVLAHERSHVRRHDPALQFLSALHRALLWHSPLSWVLHRQIVRVAEDASDDAAVAMTQDRAFYAEVLLGFMQPGIHSESGIPMARYGSPDARIHRILDGTALSRGVTRGSLAAILLVAAPLTYLAAAANVAEPPRVAPQASHAQALPPETAAPVRQVAVRAKAMPPYLRGLGNVAASATVVLRTRMDGELESLSFREGEVVQKGQLLASLDTRTLVIRSTNAQTRLDQDQAELAAIRRTSRRELISPLESKVNDDQAEMEKIKLEIEYNQIRSPIAGIAGLRMVDAGNMVHAGEPIVIVTQVQPAAVLFRLPEDALPQIHASMKNGASPVVEVWNRDSSVRMGSGRLEAVDNQIDEQTGTIKLKATFENKDGELVPGEFVNVRLILGGR